MGKDLPCNVLDASPDESSSAGCGSNQLCIPKRASLDRIDLSALPPGPLVSVIVPSFNQGKYIRATIESILGQDYRPLEIHVIDGASRDETVAVLRSFQDQAELKWTSEPDRGVVDAVNKGFARARGHIVAIQSSDDCYLPGTITRIVQELHNRADVGLIYGDTVKVDSGGSEIARQQIGPYSLENLFLLRTWIPQPSAFFRRELLDVLGGWDDRIPYAPDTDLWIRMAFRTEVHKVDEFLSQRRIHGEQRDAQAAKIARDYARMIDQSIEIREAPADLHRAAHAGKHLIRVRYNPYHSDWYAAWSLLRAGLIAPQCMNMLSIWQHLAVFPVRRLGSRVKRLLPRLFQKVAAR